MDRQKYYTYTSAERREEGVKTHGKFLKQAKHILYTHTQFAELHTSKKNYNWSLLFNTEQKTYRNTLIPELVCVCWILMWINNTVDAI